MHISHPAATHADARGAITDLLSQEPIDSITLITSMQGATRGHHYHKETTQWVYVLSGRLKLLSQIPGAAVETSILGPGDLVVNGPLERHAMTALDDATFLVFTRGPRGGENYEQDTYRLADPLRDPAAGSGRL
jgi:quercetin dioxygenase-like cupin family protein